MLELNDVVKVHLPFDKAAHRIGLTGNGIFFCNRVALTPDDRVNHLGQVKRVARYDLTMQNSW